MFEFCKLKKRIVDLEDTVSQLRRDTTGVKLEWQDALERLNTLLARLAKREQRARDLSEQEGAQGNEGGVVPRGSPEPRLATLSPRAQLIQHQIEERRKQLQKGGTTE